MNHDSLFCVVDTNVAMAANGKASVSHACALACVTYLHRIMKEGRVAIDDGGRIIKEYRNHLSGSGQPGVGDGFLKWLYTFQGHADRCALVKIIPRPEDPNNFVQFPDHPHLKRFDPSDRKFVAVSAAHPERPPILQAADSKWWGWKEALRECKIEVLFLCPKDIERLFRRKIKE